VFHSYDRLLVTTWGHDPAIISTSNILLTLNDALSHSAILVQGYASVQIERELVHVPFPLPLTEGDNAGEDPVEVQRLSHHVAISELDAAIDLRHTCGYVTMLNTSRAQTATELLTDEMPVVDSSDPSGLSVVQNGVKQLTEPNWTLLDCHFGIPLFDSVVNKAVCQRIAKYKLCHQHSLDQLVESNLQNY
jgi:hypothetical protein